MFGYVILLIRYDKKNRACEEKFLGGPARSGRERAICLECPRPSPGVGGAKINYFSELINIQLRGILSFRLEKLFPGGTRLGYGLHLRARGRRLGKGGLAQMFDGLRARLASSDGSSRITQANLASAGLKGGLAELKITKTIQEPLRHDLEAAKESDRCRVVLLR